jgi:hypothetical protein
VFQIASRKLWLATGFSILVLLPCVWHRRVEAGDLGSHLYNAWLAQLIGRGQAPRLYIVPQWNNILADLAFAWLGRVTVRAEDLPLAEIYQCDLTDLSRLCIRDLAVGELNGQGGYIPQY